MLAGVMQFSRRAFFLSSLCPKVQMKGLTSTRDECTAYRWFCRDTTTLVQMRVRKVARTANQCAALERALLSGWA